MLEAPKQARVRTLNENSSEKTTKWQSSHAYLHMRPSSTPISKAFLPKHHTRRVGAHARTAACPAPWRWCTASPCWATRCRTRASCLHEHKYQANCDSTVLTRDGLDVEGCGNLDGRVERLQIAVNELLRRLVVLLSGGALLSTLWRGARTIELLLPCPAWARAAGEAGAGREARLGPRMPRRSGRGTGGC